MNNEGWGLSSMFAFCFIFLFGITLSAIVYNKNFSEEARENENIDIKLATSVKDVMKKSDETEEKEVVKQKVNYKSTSEYKKLEEKLSKSAQSYFNNIKLGNYKIIVSLEELISKGYIKTINDPENDSKCNGYVIYDGEKVDSYIKCIGTYQTDNYNKEFE